MPSRLLSQPMTQSLNRLPRRRQIPRTRPDRLWPCDWLFFPLDRLKTASYTVACCRTGSAVVNEKYSPLPG